MSTKHTKNAKHTEPANPTAIVTGASSGIGLALTKALLDNGYRVVANARRASAAGTLEPSPNLVLVDGDVADPETAATLTRTAVERFGSVDLLVNNAGIFIGKGFTDSTAEDFQRLISTNITGFFHVTQPAIRQMLTQGSGHVVTITTSLATQPIDGVPAALSILTKGGLNAITRALAIEYAKDGVRVNAVAPGIVDTPMHPQEAHDFLQALHPIERLASVDEIADAVLYLDKATFITGELVHVDGGAHAGRW
jgi:NAD(P)-dependent dehydrogenase (short-subunit alcohol dehydrogenase family)